MLAGVSVSYVWTGKLTFLQLCSFIHEPLVAFIGEADLEA